MYENMTFSAILKNMLEKVSDDFDKRQGSVIYDAVAPICAELSKAYIELSYVLEQGFADTANRKYLVKRALERGIYPFEATKSIVLAKLLGNIDILKGEKFATDDNVIFVYMGEKEGEYYKLQCERCGAVGNISYGEIMPINNIQNLESGEIYKLFVAGIEEEETEIFRKRYLNSFNSQAFGGNRCDYMEKLNLLNNDKDVAEQGGIGGIKVYRGERGGGYVDIVITNNNYMVPTDELLKIVKEKIDPPKNSGEGLGIAPIGHIVLVKPAKSINIDISMQIEVSSAYNISMLKNKIDEKICEYITNVRKMWQENVYLTIRISHIESTVLNILGIEDVRLTKINGYGKNFVLDEDTIPIRGHIDVS